MVKYIRGDFYNKTEIKELFGFTDTMIRSLLPPPMERPNPTYRTGAPMKLWCRSDVEQVVSSSEYAIAKEKADKRRKSALKGTAAKRTGTANAFDASIAGIRVRRPDRLRDDESVLREGVAHKESLDLIHGRWGGDYFHVDMDTKRRWAVNYIRHELTDYDANLYAARGMVGVHDEYRRYKVAVLDTIAETYPFLADECERQKPVCERITA